MKRSYHAAATAVSWHFPECYINFNISQCGKAVTVFKFQAAEHPAMLKITSKVFCQSGTEIVYISWCQKLQLRTKPKVF